MAALNGVKIDNFLRPRVKIYRGTFSSDNLCHETGLTVYNTDPHYLPGSHWIVVYISSDRQTGEYFDSFGRPPNQNFTSYMNGHCRYWTHNRRQLQSVSSKLCGHYCLMYCICRSRGMNVVDFSSRFVKCDTGFNDYVVRRFFRSASK